MPEPPTPPQPLLSVLIPVYNEARTLRTIVRRVLASPVGLPMELVCVDDGSRDGSADILDSLAAADSRIRVIRQPRNMGKGAAIITAIKHMRGDIGLIQDADLEYDPADLPVLLEAIERGEADVVYGSRFLENPVQDPSRVHRLGNWLLTFASNLTTGQWLTDMETCYKLFRREIIQQIDIEQDRFGFEPEITAKVAKLKVRIYEVGVSYYGRTYEEGKKIGWKDGVSALRCILKYNLLR
jgi:glycosyltransferase involved in cell wall biosynthesis